MNYNETLNFIHSLGNFSLPAGLDRIKKVLEIFNLKIPLFLGEEKAEYDSENFKGVSGFYGEIIEIKDYKRYETDNYYSVIAKGEINGKITPGFFAPYSHRVVPATDCIIQSKLSMAVLDKFVMFANEVKLSEETITLKTKCDIKNPEITIK